MVTRESWRDDAARWNARYAEGAPTFEPHPFVAEAFAAGFPEGPVLELACGRSGSALALAERAVKLRETGSGPPELLAQARFALARALWEAPDDAGRDHARALVLAEQARDGVRALGEAGTELLANLEKWLAEHPVAPP